ncbi:hypothetical protein IQ07DRAFT_498701 [Pyrenochaeta sp. DS3sAY3a]|nr:hypothetical protein IQ07DRAFT_498701 [Pyrenochaeta sp. DS3sAY3a]
MSINPIIPGFAPDPSLVLVDGTYYLVNSTFHLYPGLPIYTSKNLVHWHQIGNALNRPGQLHLTKSSTTINPLEDGTCLLATGGLYAPTIRYRDGTFYIVCTNVVHQNAEHPQQQTQNFIISTTDIHSSAWSDPVYFDFHGIDPSLSSDLNGNAYICGSKSPGPETKITVFQIDVATGEKLTPDKVVFSGTGGIYPEGPHIYFIHDTFYLVIAEGGTHEHHSVVVARSKDIFGPYEASPKNPALTARDTDEYVQATGHLELFQDTTGQWWGVCLGIREAEKELYGLGRETFLTKASWDSDGWVSFARVKTDVEVPGVHIKDNEKLTAAPGVDLVYIRDPQLSRYTIASSFDAFTLQASRIDISDPEASPTFIGKRQRRFHGASSVTLTASDPDLSAGLALYKDEHRFLRISASRASSSQIPTLTFEAVNAAQGIHRSEALQLEASFSTVAFTISSTELAYTALFSIDGREVQELGRATAAELSNRDFVGPVVGVFVVGEVGEAVFRDFVVDAVGV